MPSPLDRTVRRRRSGCGTPDTCDDVLGTGQDGVRDRYHVMMAELSGWFRAGSAAIRL